MHCAGVYFYFLSLAYFALCFANMQTPILVHLFIQLVQNHVLALAPDFLVRKTAQDVFSRHTMVRMHDSVCNYCCTAQHAYCLNCVLQSYIVLTGMV